MSLKPDPEQSPYAHGDREPSASRNQEAGEEQPQPLFPLGQVVATSGALEALRETEQDPLELLTRHVTGDWGDLSEEDKEENEFSVDRQLRILSAYKLSTGTKIWVISEADRSATTFLLPEDY
jgi:hypothetical protein